MNDWLDSHRILVFSVLGTLITIALIIFVVRWQTPAPITIIPPEATSTPGPFAVYVSGAVKTPGVYPLPAGSRVEDALAVGGGPTADADLDHVNLAARLSDGAQVYIPFMGEFGPEILTLNGTVGLVDPLAGLININEASVEELDALPGIGPALAGRIIAYREERGPFTAIENIMDVSGIGPACFENIQSLITVGE